MPKHVTENDLADKSFETINYSVNPSIPFNVLRPNKKITLTGNTVITNTSTVNGSSGLYNFTQDTTGSRTVSINGTSISINPAANSSTLVGWCYDGVIYIFDTNYSPLSTGVTTSVRNIRSSSSGNRYAVAFGARTVESGGGGDLSDGSQTIETSRLKYKAIGNISELSVVFVNGNRSSQDAITPTNSITITASIEYDYIAPNGTVTTNTIQQITFRGSASYILPRDKSITSDVITAEIPDGAYFWIRSCVTVTAGQKWYKTQATRAAYSEGATSGSDTTMSGTISNSTTYVFGPVAILGVSSTNKASIQWVGDSIASGVGDSGGTQYSFGTGLGIYGRVFMDTYPGIMHNRSGDSFADWLPRAHPHFSSIIGTTNYFISELGINDLSRALAVNQASAITIWDAFMARGVYGYQTTITPNTTSTDNWATVANQTVTGNEARRTGFNDWIRDGAPIDKVTRMAQAVGAVGSSVIRANQVGHPLLGYFEVADSVESSRNSGKFKTGPLTADGLHLNSAGYTLAAATIDVTKFNLW